MTDRMAILAVMTGAALVGLALGYSIPLVALRLTAQGHGASLLGMVSALPAMGMFVASLASPAIARRLTVKRILWLSTLGMALCLALSCYLERVVWLALPRLMMGFCCGLMVVMGESWISGNAAPHRRGLLIGLYAAAFTGLQLLGPLLLALTGVDSLLALWLVLALHALCLLMTGRASFAGMSLQIHQQRSLTALLRTAPALAIAVFTFAFFDGAVLAMLPLYGIASGYEQRVAVLLVTVLFIGDALLQAPLGWLSDRLGAARVHLGCGAMLVLLLAALPWSYGVGWVWAHVFVLGAVAGGIYTLSLVRASQRFAGAELVAVNALFGVLWGVGSFCGPMVSGAAMAWFGPQGLILTLALLGGISLAVNLRRSGLNRPAT